MRGNSDYSEIAALIQKTLEPLIVNINTKVDRLSEKVDELARDHATRSDMEKLRNEIHVSFVSKDVYETRHANLIARDSFLESEIKRIDAETQVEIQRLYEKLERGKQQVEDGFRDQAKAELSEKDRGWLRASYIGTFIAIVIAILDYISQHIKFQ